MDDSVDQAIRVRDKKNVDDFYFAYGGDFGDTCNDAQFCCNVRENFAKRLQMTGIQASFAILTKCCDLYIYRACFHLIGSRILSYLK